MSSQQALQVLMRYDEVMTSGTPQVGVCSCFFLWYVFLVTHVGELAHLRCFTLRCPKLKEINSVERYPDSHHALLPVLVIPRPKRKQQLLLTSVYLCNHSLPMTQGQGEGKVKLHTVNW